MTDTYRNVTLDDDGTVDGERQYGTSGTWFNFRASLNLLIISLACDDDEGGDEIWALQDGYGEPGFTPTQGWDWSGIRDSSKEAKQQMLHTALRYITPAEVADRLGVTEEAVRSTLHVAYQVDDDGH